jgi:[acyl-carrier-protein] S-malonyltransferase
MGADIFEARPDLVGDGADAVLGFNLRRVCLEGPEEELTRTDRAQPALFALSYALWEEFSNAAGVSPAATAGHSLGEYTALAAAGVFDFTTALRLVAARGNAMAEAAALEPSSMAALIGADAATAEEVAGERRRLGGRLWVANLNAPGQVVVAGSAFDIDWLQEHGREVGVRRVVPLRVAGAFHSPFMEPATRALEEALAVTEPHPAQFPVWANVTARPAPQAEVKKLLAGQVVAPVRFSDTLLGMAEDGIDVFVHIGPGDVTAGMARRTVPGAEVLVVSDMGTAATVAEELSLGGEDGG